VTPRPFDPQTPQFEEPLQLARDGRHEEAVRRLLRTVRDGGLHEQHRAAATRALAHIARSAEAAGDLATAANAVAEALRIAPGYPDLHYQHACLLVGLRDRAGARRALGDALRLNPRYVAARVEMALLDAREGLLAEAMDALRRLGEEQPIGDVRAFRQGLQSLEQAEWDEAGELLRQALQLAEPGTEEIIQQFHQHLARGERAAAVRLLQSVIREHPAYADLHLLLGTIELEDGHLDDALASLARALELHPDFHAARVQFARALEALGDLAQANEQIAMVLEQDPKHPQAIQLEERWRRMRAGGRRVRRAANRAA
jgi:tetratricopeptide (TPR) repeat protein